MFVCIADLNVEQLIAPVQDLEHADTWTCMWVIVQECTAGLSLSFCWWEVGRISGKLKHSPAQRKTALRSCGPWWRHSWLRLWTQSGPTRTARVPLRNRFPANTHKKEAALNVISITKVTVNKKLKLQCRYRSNPMRTKLSSVELSNS